VQELERHLYRYLSGLVVFVLAVGTIFYHIVEKMTWINAYYFSVTTLSTVGYGDLYPKTNAGKIFTTFYIFAGVGVITSFISLFMRRRKDILTKRIAKK
jgi:voltage-gated potassium channel Kch